MSAFPPPLLLLLLQLLLLVVVVTCSVIELFDMELAIIDGKLYWSNGEEVEDVAPPPVNLRTDRMEGGPLDSRLDMQLVVREDEFFPLSIEEGPDITDVLPLSRLEGPLSCMLRKCFSRS